MGADELRIFNPYGARVFHDAQIDLYASVTCLYSGILDAWAETMSRMSTRMLLQYLDFQDLFSVHSTCTRNRADPMFRAMERTDNPDDAPLLLTV